MRPQSTPSLHQQFSSRQQRFCQHLRAIAISFCVVIAVCLVINLIKLASASSRTTEAFLVLGGSIQREIYVTQLAKQHPQTPILISQGSPDPCIWKIFQQQTAPPTNVWLEKCATSTFENLYFNLPILQKWQIQKITLITSPSHLPRAKWLAQIMLGSHGIWVDTETVSETGIPGNRETWLKTGLDLTRSIIWAVFSQVLKPQCSHITKLTAVDISAWEKHGFKCEHQGNIN